MVGMVLAIRCPWSCENVSYGVVLSVVPRKC